MLIGYQRYANKAMEANVIGLQTLKDCPGSSDLQVVRLEPLESRRLLSVTAPIARLQTEANGSTVLHIFGTPASDTIHAAIAADGDVAVRVNGVTEEFSGGFSSILVTGEAGDDSIHIGQGIDIPAVLRGGAGNDTLAAGGASDELYGGAGNNSLIAGSEVGENDTLVGVGGGTDTLAGGAGLDAFWAGTGDIITGATSAERSLGSVNRVSTIAQATPNAASASLGEPSAQAGYHYADFSGDPLFAAAGPTADDVKQGQVGDCYFLAALSAIARADPARIEQEIVQLNDGTYLVHFTINGNAAYEHLDARLPVNSGGTVAYAALGAGQSLWVALLEKAFAQIRYGMDSYSAIAGGWMSEAFADLGLNSADTWSASTASALMQLIQADLAQKQAVTLAINAAPSGSLLIGDHSYMVDGVVTDSDGNITGLRLRNPWGTVGVNGVTNQGYLTITPQQALAGLWVVTSAAA